MINITKLAYKKIISTIKHDNYRVVKFIGVGFTSVLINFLFFNLFIVLFNIPAVLAVIFADQIAILVAFYIHNIYTYKSKSINEKKAILRAFLSFYLLVSFSTLLQAFIVNTGIKLFGKSLILYNIYYSIGIIIGFVWNYTTQNLIVWKRKKTN